MIPRHEQISLPEHIADFIPAEMKSWLVGGSVRDAVLGRALKDIDIVVDGPAGKAADSIAKGLGCTSFIMDAERRIYRVVCKSPAVQVDISDAPGGILEDLSARDFTINAMAVPLGSGGMSKIIDPFGGMADIETARIRALGKAALTDDPLRLLRAFRLEASLGFDVEPVTLGWIRELSWKINDVSPERVRDELYLILDAPSPSEAFRRMWDAGLLGELLPEAGEMRGIPQPPPHEHELLEHAFRSMHHAESITATPEAYFDKHAGTVAAMLSEPVEPPLTMRGLIVLCALFHDIGKPVTMKFEGERPRFIGHDSVGADLAAGIARRLRTSARVREVIEAVTRHHMRPLMLSRRDTGRRALYRLSRDTDASFVPLMAVALADALATRERPGSLESDVEGFVIRATEYYFGDYAAAKEAPLITGRDLIEGFGLTPGPLLGSILRDVEEARAEGTVTDREEAMEYVRSNLTGYGG